MRSDNLTQVRGDCIERMKDTLATVEPTSAPRWLITLMVIPLFTWEAGKIGLLMVWNGLKGIAQNLVQVVLIPFVGIYIYVDILIVMRWFFARIVDKMSEKEKQ